MAPPLYEFPDPQGFIRFPRSDGDRQRHPGGAHYQPEEDVAPYYLVPLHSKKNKDWRLKVGEVVARVLMGLKETTHPFCLVDFPEGYGLYEHPRKYSENRAYDLYLFGSDHGKCFRSPGEFVPHAIWLLTHTELERDRGECGDTYISGRPQSEISAELGMRFTGGGATNRSPILTGPPRPLPLVDTALPPVPSRPEQFDDPKSHTRTRVPREGELIWVKLPTPLSPPASSSSEPSIPVIALWPCVVLSHSAFPYILAPSNPAPPQSQKVWEAQERSRKRYNETFKVRALGTQQETTVLLDATLPYLAYSPPEELVSYLATLRPNPYHATFNTLVLAQPFPRRAADPPTAALPHGAWDDTWPGYVLALDIARHLKGYWTLTDPPLVLSPATHTQYDGLFWGPERIWRGELARLYFSPLNESEDPAQLASDDYRRHILRNLSPGADKRGVFVRVEGIHLLLHRSDGEKPARQCWIEGTVYETVPAPALPRSQSRSAIVAGVAVSVDEDGVSDGSTSDGDIRQSMDRMHMQRSGGDRSLPPSPRIPQRLPNVPLDTADAQESFLAGVPVLALPPPGLTPASAPTTAFPPLPSPPRGYTFRPLLAPSERVYIALRLLAGRYHPFISSSPLLALEGAAREGMDELAVWEMAGRRPAEVAYVKAGRCLERAEGVERADKAARKGIGEKWGLKG